jgi:colanic acid/amylovoran biosynthesis glycosyltransferase
VGGPERPVRLLTIGRLSWKKGYEYGLDAARILVERGVSVEYRIIGDGDYWEAVHFWRHQNALDGVVEIMGSVRHEAIVDHLAWADLLLHPAVTEAFGNAVIEAQAMSLAVVCSDAGGLPENVADGVTGLIVARRDPVALADAVEALARDGDRRIAMGRAGRRRVLEKFGIGDQLDAVEAFYSEALGA